MIQSTNLITVKIKDEVNCQIEGLADQHRDFFYNEYSLFVNGYYFMPLFRRGKWDGKLHYFLKDGSTYVRLLEEIIPKIVRLGYKVDIIDDRVSNAVYPPLITDDYFSSFLHPETKQPIILRGYQVESVNSLITQGWGIIIAGTGSGKAQPLYSKILTPDGWISMGDIQKNTKIITPTGAVSKVIGVFPQGLKDIYEIIFHDDSKTRCSGDHLWEVKAPKNLKHTRTVTEETILTTLQIKRFIETSHLRRKLNISIPILTPLDIPDIELPIPPYLLGVLLGGGCFRGGVTVSNKDEFIIHQISQVLTSMGLSVVKVKGVNYDYRIVKSHPNTYNHYAPHALLNFIRELGLFGLLSSEKFIPDVYLQSSIQQRLELLQGLFDTDGTVSRSSPSFSSTSYKLIQGVQTIIQSLGGIARVRRSYIPTYTYRGEKRKGKLSHTLSISYPHPISLFSLPRKRDQCKELYDNGRTDVRRRFKSVKLIGREPCQCILIDHPSHLYITDNYIVTHNTLVTAALADSYGRLKLKTITIVPNRTLILQTKEAYELCGLDVGEYTGKRKDVNHLHVVTTWQALQNNPQLLSVFRVAIVDECVTGDTLISMTDGTSVPIKNIKQGDNIISYNIATHQFEEDSVVKLHENLLISETETLYELEFDNGITIHITGNHKILTDNRGWVRANCLIEEDIITTYP